LSTCWHGKEGFCEVCYAIVGETHLKAVEKNGEKDKDKKKDKE